MKVYTEPSVEVIRFGGKNIVTTSVSEPEVHEINNEIIAGVAVPHKEFKANEIFG